MYSVFKFEDAQSIETHSKCLCGVQRVSVSMFCHVLCTPSAPMGTPIMHIDQFVRGKGLFVETDYEPTEERTNRKFPLLLTTRSNPVAVQRRGADETHGEHCLAR